MSRPSRKRIKIKSKRHVSKDLSKIHPISLRQGSSAPTRLVGWQRMENGECNFGNVKVLDQLPSYVPRKNKVTR